MHRHGRDDNASTDNKHNAVITLQHFKMKEHAVHDNRPNFYEVAMQLLERFYPQRLITVTSRDPYYITAAIKAKLRRKNRLMRAGRIEEASALAQRIGKDIVRRNKTRLSHISSRTSVKDL